MPREFRKWNHIKFNPPQILAIGFLGIIILGALLLLLPISTYPGQRLSILDALFESTSAVCVTGLVVTDTATTFTMFGEIVLLVLIQTGGLGFMTFGVLVALMIGKKIGLTERLLIQSSLNQFNVSGIVALVKLILISTLIIESIAALLLSLSWSKEMGWGQAIYFGIFHAISAFNNAGFDITGGYTSLTKEVGNLPINLIISGLFILGGLGFTVIIDVIRNRKVRRWSLHTKLVLILTLVINIVASLLIFYSEYNNPNTLGPLSTGDKIIASYFHGTVPRTAGFNTLDLTALNSESILLTMGLMFIGGSSGSTAGGIKITTFLMLILVAWSFIRQKEDITLLRRRIPKDLVFRALSISVLGIFLVFGAIFLLEISEKHISLMGLAFEAVSAFGTVGLSLGVTPELTAFGKCVIMILMFVGRLGPLTIAFALTDSKRKGNIRYVEEKILIG